MSKAVNVRPFPNQFPIVYNSLNKRFNTADAYDGFLNLKTVEYTPIVESKPLPYVDYIRNLIVPNTPANVYVADGEIVIDGSVAKQSLYTRKHGRYLPGLVGLAGIGVRMATPDVGVYEFGYGNDNNRMGLAVSNGQWSVFIQSQGNRYIVVPREQWDDPLDGTGQSKIDIDKIDKSKIVLRIYIGWYGYASINFQLVINGETVPIHDIVSDYAGVSIAQPDLPIFAEATGGILYVGGRQYGVYGRYRPEERVTATPRVDAVLDSTFQPVTSIRIKQDEMVRGVPVKLSSIAGILDASSEYIIYLNEPEALTGAVWEAIPETTTNGTVLEYDTSTTALADGGYKMFSNIVGASSQGNSIASSALDLPDIELPPGLVLTIVARSLATTTNTSVVLRLREEW